jgi:hypothetical protein
VSWRIDRRPLVIVPIRWAAGDRAVVGDEDQGEPALAPQPVEQGDDLVPGVLVEVPGRLVGEQHPRLLDQGAGDRDALLLAAGEFGGRVLGPVAEADAAQRGPDPFVAS